MVKKTINTKNNSDNGGEFIADIVTGHKKVHGIKEFINSSPHHPQTNGQVERVNQTIVNRLKAASGEDLNWSKYLVDATHNYNGDEHGTTGYSPLELHQPHLVLRKKVSVEKVKRHLHTISISVLINLIIDETYDELDAVVDLFERVRYTLIIEETVQQNSTYKANKSIERWEKQHNIRAYQPGDKVLVNIAKTFKKSRQMRIAEIAELFKGGNYSVKYLNGEFVGNLGTVNVDRIEPFYEDLSKSNFGAILPTNTSQSDLNLFNNINDIKDGGLYRPESEQVEKARVTSKVKIRSD